MKSIFSYSLFQTQLFVGMTVRHFSIFLSHSSFSKCSFGTSSFCTLYYSAKCPIHLHRVLSQDLSTLYNWSKVWNINFNPSKTAVITISNQRNIHPLSFFNNAHLSETDTHNHLGLIFHHSLFWHTHILHLHQKVITKINRLRSFSNPLPRHSLLTIYKTNILPIFDYGSIIYDNCCDSDKHLLDKAHLCR